MNKKYSPSVEKNNSIKEEIVNELNSLIYFIEKGRISASLQKDSVKTVLKELKDATDSLTYSIGTGEENISAIFEDLKKQIKEFKRVKEQELTTKFVKQAEDIVFTISLWKEILDGNIVLNTDEEVQKAKTTRGRRKLDAKLSELERIKNAFEDNSLRLNKEIVEEEKGLEELENQILNEDNERVINDIYRKIKSTKSKLDMLYIRRGNYSACHELLDIIYSNVKEILVASDFEIDEQAKAKVFLNMSKLSQVLNQPEKAISILQHMEKDLKNITANTDLIDKKVFDLDKGNTTVNENALQYKEELMRKKREKETLNNSLKATNATINNEEMNEEKN